MMKSSEFKERVVSGLYAALVMILMLGLIVYVLLQMGDGAFQYSVRHVDSLSTITLVQ